MELGTYGLAFFSSFPPHMNQRLDFSDIIFPQCYLLGTIWRQRGQGGVSPSLAEWCINGTRLGTRWG